MRYTGNKITLHLVQTVLFIPIDKNNINTRKNKQHKEATFKQNQPFYFSRK
ncbi:MAG: hypothetical protein Ct9H300mP23_11760 [Nitrospinota bacterium]|nr:MAG: hypothetical protein Ct9H300mP23_11760 [Nitrospinota bacterium]